MSLDVAHLTHQVAGRYRIRIPSRRRDDAYFQTIIDSLSKHEQIIALSANSATASIPIEHDGLTLSELTDLAQEHALFELTDHALPVNEILDTVAGKFSKLNQQLTISTGDNLNMRAAAFILFVAVGVRQLIKGQLFGPAATLFWHAYQILMSDDKEK